MSRLSPVRSSIWIFCLRLVCVHVAYMDRDGGQRVSVLIADDQRLFAEALEAILSTDGGSSVVGRALDGQAAVDLGARAQRPDVVLMDLRMPGIDGFEATEAIREASTGDAGARADRLGATGRRRRAPARRAPRAT